MDVYGNPRDRRQNHGIFRGAAEEHSHQAFDLHPAVVSSLPKYPLDRDGRCFQPDADLPSPIVRAFPPYYLCRNPKIRMALMARNATERSATLLPNPLAWTSYPGVAVLATCVFDSDSDSPALCLGSR